jgi:hypothetical protein
MWGSNGSLRKNPGSGIPVARIFFPLAAVPHTSGRCARFVSHTDYSAFGVRIASKKHHIAHHEEKQAFALFKKNSWMHQQKLNPRSLRRAAGQRHCP